MKEGTTRTVLDITPSCEAQQLVEIYKKNPKEARIIYMNTGTKIIEKSLILWEDANGDWDISETEKSFGISITNKMYSRYVKTGSYMCKRGNFYLKFKGKKSTHLSQLTWDIFIKFVRDNDSPGMKEFMERLFKEQSWLRFVNENPMFHNIALNTFVKYKLYSRNKALKHFLKVPLPTALKLVEAVHQKEYLDRLFKEWKVISKMVTNVENLRPDILSNQYFVDTCRMAHVVGEKINLAWSDLRLKEEHDKYAELITHTILATMEEKPLRIRKEYQDFCEKYGFHLFKTNKELFEEGRIQRHCVGTYEWEVNRGACAIFKYGGYTGELRYIEPSYERRLIKTLDGPPIEDFISVKSASLQLNQFRGYLNRKAPDELSKEVYDKLDEFNEYLKTATPAIHDTSGLTLSKNEWFMRYDNSSRFNIFAKPYKHESLVEIIVRDEMAWDDLVQGDPVNVEVMREQ